MRKLLILRGVVTYHCLQAENIFRSSLRKFIISYHIVPPNILSKFYPISPPPVVNYVCSRNTCTRGVRVVRANEPLGNGSPNDRASPPSRLKDRSINRATSWYNLWDTLSCGWNWTNSATRRDSHPDLSSSLQFSPQHIQNIPQTYSYSSRRKYDNYPLALLEQVLVSSRLVQWDDHTERTVVVDRTVSRGKVISVGGSG